MRKRINKDRPRYKVVNQIESSFKRDFAKIYGKGIGEVVKKIKYLTK